MRKKGYWAIDFQGEINQLYVMMAQLEGQGMEGYEMGEDRCRGYIRMETASADFFREMQALSSSLGITVTHHFIPEKNWNALWESNFSPVIIADRLLIKATFHDVPSTYPHEIVISPKMAFGTGHHETTYMMLEQMLDMEWEGQTVLDLGSGTGILSIFARMRGAGEVTALDIQPEAGANAVEHMALNGVEGIIVLTGEVSSLRENSYDVILANINRKVIMDTLGAMYTMLNAGGILLISGILKEDETLVLERAHSAGFAVDAVQDRGNWICARLERGED